MNKVAYVFLADGFEEIEAVTPIDILRRADIPVYTVGLNERTVRGAHGILIQADLEGKDFALPDDAAIVILPGGGEGTDNLKASPMIAQVLDEANKRGLYVAAICAAPVVLHKAGLLEGRRVTAFPSVQQGLSKSIVTGSAVEVDGTIITARAAGVAIQFAHAMVSLLRGDAVADAVIEGIYPE